MKVVGNLRIALELEELILKNCCFIPSFQRNLISVPCLVKDNYSVVFNASGMSLLHGRVIVGTAILDGLFRLNTYS